MSNHTSPGRYKPKSPQSRRYVSIRDRWAQQDFIDRQKKPRGRRGERKRPVQTVTVTPTVSTVEEAEVSVLSDYGFDSLPITKLRRLGGKLGIKGARAMKKDDLIPLITEIVVANPDKPTQTNDDGTVIVAGVEVV